VYSCGEKGKDHTVTIRAFFGFGAQFICGFPKMKQCWSYDNFINHDMNEIFGKRAFSLWIMEKGLKTRLKTMERFSIIGP
jgi:hypothetical protein